MDTIHDMGGLHGFGRVKPEDNEPVFHAEWEKRVFAMTMAVPFAVVYGDDQLRPAIERIAPDQYLKFSYYEKWLDALTGLLLARGAITQAELANPDSVARAPLDPNAARPDVIVPAIFGGASQGRPDAGLAKRFKVGDRIITKRHGAAGHTRLPRYARGKAGRIEAVQGAFLVADLNTHGDQTPEMLYTVVFQAHDIWGSEARIGDTLTLDLWDRYLEPA